MWSFLLLLFQSCLIQFINSDCLVDPLQLNPTPIIFDSHLQMIYPDSTSRINQIATNTDIFIACPGSQVLQDNIALGEHVECKCIDNTLFSLQGGQTIDFYKLRCVNIPKDTIRYTNKACVEGGQEIEIGFSIGRNTMFLPLVRVCFDNINLTPIYSQFNLTKNIGYRDGRVPRKCFEEDGFYSTSTTLDNLYHRNVERATINNLLNLEGNSEAFIKRTGELFINRGHLTAKGDFVFAFQQLSTFHYVNSAPQWASFNGGNWNELEISLRDYADYKQTDLEVYTGVHGVASLMNQNIFLHTVNGRYLMPVPQLFWKLILDKLNDESVVIVGVNNAYQVDANRDVICTDVSSNVTWFNNKLKGQKTRVELGYIYACTISEFRSVVASAPRINTRGLLV